MTNKASFQWKSYIDLARNLLDQVPLTREDDQETEAKARCGISRTYYGAFHIVAVYLQRTGFVPNTVGAGSHLAVINACLELNDKHWHKIGENLKILKDKRIRADYRDVYFNVAGLSKGRFHRELEMAIALTDKILEELRYVEADSN